MELGSAATSSSEQLSQYARDRERNKGQFCHRKLMILRG